MNKYKLLTSLALSLSSALLSNTVNATEKPTVKQAEKFLVDAEKNLLKSNIDFARVHYVYDTYVTRDTGILLSKEFVKNLDVNIDYAHEAAKFDHVQLDNTSRRKMNRIKQLATRNTPLAENKKTEFRKIQRSLWQLNSKKTDCNTGVTCLTKQEINKKMTEDHSSEELLSLWQQGHEKATEVLPFYQQLISITNNNVKTLGFANTFDYWIAPYQEKDQDITKKLAQTWQQIKPLYSALQCHVSDKLRTKYGENTVSSDSSIPAHLLGNLSADNFNNLYDLVKVDTNEPPFFAKVTAGLANNKVDAIKMVKQAEKFYSSMGFEALPETFYKYSQFVEPNDHKVECYPAGWVMDFKDDIRLRMCIKPTGEDFVEAHKQLSYLIDARAHNQQSFVFNEYPNEAFNSALKETVSLSMTPAYLESAQLIKNNPSESSQLNAMMKLALEKVSSLPFYLALNQWQQAAISSDKSLETLNDYWWQLREQYQGISRDKKSDKRVFDFGVQNEAMNLAATGVKHYMSTLLQFQFHQSLCELEDGNKPLHQCSIYNSKLAGEKLKAMLSLGASQPWPEALAKITGKEQLDGTALVNYFSPLQQYLNKQNEGLSCGW
jgi:peptidyl-dipeptidase A